MTIEEIKNLTDDEIRNFSTIKKEEILKNLNKEIDVINSKYNYNKAMQLGLKLVLNGTYGAFAHPKFVVSNKHIANAITTHGRDVILYMLNKIQNYFYNKWHNDKETHELLKTKYIAYDENDKWYMLNYKYEIIEWGHKDLNELLRVWNIKFSTIRKLENKTILINDKKYTICYERNIFDFKEVRPIDNTIIGDRDKMDDYDIKFHKEELITYGDTDSTSYDTIIITNNGEYTIEELYNMNIGQNMGKTLLGHESVKCSFNVLNWSEDKNLYFAPVKRIIRHKVKKSKWKLRTKQGKEIIITNDHSMIVFRQGKKIKIKPAQILKDDKILIVEK